MSVYVNRYYEVRIKEIDQYSNNKEIEEGIKPKKELYDGYTVCNNQYGEFPYHIWNEKTQTWDKSRECRRKWVLVKNLVQSGYDYYPLEFDCKIGEVPVKVKKNEFVEPRKVHIKEGEKFNECICRYDNGGVIRDDYISPNNWYLDDCGFPERGIPFDASEDLKLILEEEKKYALAFTYVTVEEWAKAFKSRFERFKADIKKTMDKSEIKKLSDRIDVLEKMIKDPSYEKPKKKKKKTEDEDDGYYDSVDFLWDEEFPNLIGIKQEIQMAYDMIEGFGYIDSEDIRITYFLS